MSLRFNFAVNAMNPDAVCTLLKTNFGDDAKTEIAMKALVSNYMNLTIDQAVKNLIREANNTDMTIELASVIDRNIGFLLPIIEKNSYHPLENWLEQLNKVQENNTPLAPRLR